LDELRGFVAVVRVAEASPGVAAVVFLVVAPLILQPRAAFHSGTVSGRHVRRSFPSQDETGVPELDLGDDLETGHAVRSVEGVVARGTSLTLEVRVTLSAVEGICRFETQQQQQQHGSDNQLRNCGRHFQIVSHDGIKARI